MFAESNELLISMAVRSNHGFGLESQECKDQIMNQMKELYRYYSEGLNDEEIAQKTKYDVVTIGQIREEVQGTGFFSPQRADFYRQFV